MLTTNTSALKRGLKLLSDTSDTAYYMYSLKDQRTRQYIIIYVKKFSSEFLESVLRNLKFLELTYIMWACE